MLGANPIACWRSIVVRSDQRSDPTAGRYALSKATLGHQVAVHMVVKGQEACSYIHSITLLSVLSGNQTVFMLTLCQSDAQKPWTSSRNRRVNWMMNNLLHSLTFFNRIQMLLMHT
jgi:hypothetical protein